jgi:hypothetical protein
MDGEMRFTFVALKVRQTKLHRDVVLPQRVVCDEFIPCKTIDPHQDPTHWAHTHKTQREFVPFIYLCTQPEVQKRRKEMDDASAGHQQEKVPFQDDFYRSAASTETATAATAEDVLNQRDTQQKATRERRWRILTIVIMVTLALLFLLLWVSVQQSEKGTNVKWRNWWSHNITHISSKMPFVKKTPMLRKDMAPGTWLIKETSLGAVPVMYFQRPRPNLPAVNWLRMPPEVLARDWLAAGRDDSTEQEDDQRGLPLFSFPLNDTASMAAHLQQMALVRAQSSTTSDNAQRHPVNILFFHGAGMGNENYYLHLRQVSTSFNVNVLSVEIPGLGERERNSKTHEDWLMVKHPQEIYEIVVQDMRWRWSDTVIWSNCFSAQIAFRTMWYLTRIKNVMFVPNEPDTVPAALFLSKVLVSYRHCVRNLLRGGNKSSPSLLTRAIPKDTFAVLPAWNEGDLPKWLQQFYPIVSCPVLFCMGSADTSCSVADAELLRKRFANSPWTRMHVIPGGKHTMSMLEIAQYESQQEAIL